MRDFQSPGRSTLYATNGVAATSHPLGARVAVEILAQGGNAVDAAIAGALVLTVAEPAMCGLGGDLFALVSREGEAEPYGLNGSGRAPAGASAEELRNAGLAEVTEDSAAAAVVPGAISGFAKLSADRGRLGFDALLAPAIRYAEEGVPVAPRAAFDWVRAAGRMQGAARRHLLWDGRPPEAGQIFRAPGLAEVMRRIARHGPGAFYEGEVAEDMVATLQTHGGVHTAEDFAAGAAVADAVTPIAAPYRGAEIVELPPNTHGATALLLAGLLDRFDIARLDPFGPMRTHLEAEACKLAYGVRDQIIADPATMTRDVAQSYAAETVRELATRIDLEHAMAPPRNPLGSLHRDTIYICAVDRDRMACSLIYSVFTSFGSAIASEKFGIWFNSRAAGFTLAPGHPNCYGPGKRPLHTIIPGMLREGGAVTMPFGVMGGAYQPCGHLRLISNMLDYGMDIQAAIDAPRSFWNEGVLMLERGYKPEVWRALEAKGHTCALPEVPLGGAQAIRIDRERGVLIAGSDPRKDGIALGY